MKNEIILFENQGLKLEVKMGDETVWLSLEQMADLFGRDKSVISRHIKNAMEEELDETTVAKFATVQKEGKREVTRNIDYYNLDVIISVGYRVKSKNGVVFRKWATRVLKDYLLQGYSVNQKRLEYLEKTVKLIDIAGRIDKGLSGDEAQGIIRVINNYSSALNLLDDYDHKVVSKPKGTVSDKMVKYEDCIDIISKLRFSSDSELFARERDKGLNSIISNIYQSFGGEDL